MTISGYYLFTSKDETSRLTEYINRSSTSSLTQQLQRFSDVELSPSIRNFKRYVVDDVLPQTVNKLFDSGAIAVAIEFRILKNHTTYDQSLTVASLYDPNERRNGLSETQAFYRILENRLSGNSILMTSSSSDLSISSQEIDTFNQILELDQNSAEVSFDNQYLLRINRTLGQDHSIANLYRDLVRLRGQEEVDRVMKSSSTSQCLDLLDQAINIGMTLDNERVISLCQQLTSDLLHSIRIDVATTVEEQLKLLESYKSHYPDIDQISEFAEIR